MIRVCPSILAADFANLQRDCTLAMESGADWLHIDVMDGHFVPNLSLGAPVLASLAKAVKSFYDVHLMVEYPSRFVEQFIHSGADAVTFHLESNEKPEDVIALVKSMGKKVGMAIKPETRSQDLAPYLPLLDMVLVMTVSPGFGGQAFLPDCLSKISEIRQMLKERGLALPIQVDGGIDETTSKQVVEAGATLLVAGSYLFRSEEMQSRIVKLKG